MEYLDAMQAINQMTQQNNEWSAKMAANQWTWEERMANTAHQREVADLKAAGLNPILSAHTNGAATPNVSVPQADSGNIGAITNLFQDWMNMENAKSLINMSGGSGSGGFSNGRNAYYGRTTLEKIIEDFCEGMFGKNADEVVRDAGAYLGNWAKENYPGSKIEAFVNWIFPNAKQNAVKQDPKYNTANNTAPNHNTGTGNGHSGGF